MILLMVNFFKSIFIGIAGLISLVISVIFLERRYRENSINKDIVNSIERQNEIKENIDSLTDSELDARLQKWQKRDDNK